MTRFKVELPYVHSSEWEVLGQTGHPPSSFSSRRMSGYDIAVELAEPAKYGHSLVAEISVMTVSSTPDSRHSLENDELPPFGHCRHPSFPKAAFPG